MQAAIIEIGARVFNPNHLISGPVQTINFDKLGTYTVKVIHVAVTFDQAVYIQQNS